MKRLFLTKAIAILMMAGSNLYSQVGINNDGSSPNSSAMLDIKSTESGLLIPRMTETQRNEIDDPALGLMIYQTDEAAGFYYYNGVAWAAVSGSGNTGHYVGELYGGGVIFWVDNTGQHGLIVSMVNLSTGISWSNVTSDLIGPTAQSDWDGVSNSNAIVLQGGHINSAAQICFDYSNIDYGTGIYSDWYLPSRGELNHLWNNIYEVQKTLDNDGNSATTAIVEYWHWSSSENNINYAWEFDFHNGYPGDSQKYSLYYVRAVRAF